MTTTFAPRTLPQLPTRMDRGIGIIGCGGICQWGSMPAYRQFGFRVAGIASRTESRVKEFASRWGIERAFTDWRHLLDMPDVEVLDVTYPFDDERVEIVAQAARRGKHVLMQKPLAHSMAAAQEMVRLAQDGGVLLAVNQNARWCPQYWAAQQAIQQGLLGDLYFAIHEMQNNQDSQQWWRSRWYAQIDRYQILEYSVHHLDLLRYWWGKEPVGVKASIGRKPNQFARGELIVSANLEMPENGLAIMVDDNASDPEAPPMSRFRIEGTLGMITGQIMPEGQFVIRSELLGPAPLRLDVEGNWFPNAFAATMGELMLAIEQARPCSISGQDNLHTLDILFKAYASAKG